MTRRIGRADRTHASPRIAVIGAGFGGLAVTIELKRAGLDDITVFEKADSVGGVWRENTYPGAACSARHRTWSRGWTGPSASGTAGCSGGSRSRSRRSGWPGSASPSCSACRCCTCGRWRAR